MQQNSISLRIKSNLQNLSSPMVMGILNVTPDSFYGKSRTNTELEIISRVAQILEEGGDIIDIGGYSTRPTSAKISEKEETDRLFLALNCIKKHFPKVPLSVDTFRASIADIVIQEFEVDIINDISGGTLDDRMFEVVAKHNTPYVLMHTRGTPQTMQTLTEYDDILEDIMRFFAERINRLTSLGVNDIILDPGFGFAKTVEQNYELLRKLSRFQLFGRPILAGLSRKSMLSTVLNTDAEHSLTATIGANMLALTGGASILRVHDVKEAVETITIYKHCYPE
jgi:dihydropteroate synthase